MQLLTPTGYKDIADVNIGDELVAYDIADGHVFNNVLEGKQWFSPEMFSDELDEDGNVVKTKEQVFAEIHGELKAYVINEQYVLFKNQSVWANLNLVHAQDLQVGDVIYDDDDNDVLIFSVSEIPVDGWWRLTVSGDHSYIADNLTLHNASRYWVGGGANTNWNATGNTNWASTSGGSNNASVPTSTDDVFFDANGNSNSNISAGTTVLSLTIDSGYTSAINFANTANTTIVNNVTFGANFTITGGGALFISGTSTITGNGKTWPNQFEFSGGGAKTIVGDFTISGVFRCGATIVLNKTTNENLILTGGITMFSPMSGTADIYLKGGTWSNSSAITNNLYIDGNVTISGSVTYGGSTFTYLSGSVTTTGSTVTFSGSPTITSGSITWNNVTFTTATTTKTLVNDLVVNGLFTTGASNQTINKTTSEILNLNGGWTVSSTLGTADVYLRGGVWSGNATIANNVYIDGYITISGTITKSGAGSILQRISGNVKNDNARLSITASISVFGFDKIPLLAVTITQNTTQTMDRFFAGTPSQICQVSSTGANYTIQFTDGFEKIGRNVAVSGATIANRGQLLLITNPRFNTNRQTNIGVRYSNTMPNGFGRGRAPITDMAFGPSGLAADPCFQRQG